VSIWTWSDKTVFGREGVGLRITTQRILLMLGLVGGGGGEGGGGGVGVEGWEEGGGERVFLGEHPKRYDIDFELRVQQQAKQSPRLPISQGRKWISYPLAIRREATVDEGLGKGREGKGREGKGREGKGRESKWKKIRERNVDLQSSSSNVAA
jgi:hypothetical protein